MDKRKIGIKLDEMLDLAEQQLQHRGKCQFDKSQFQSECQIELADSFTAEEQEWLLNRLADDLQVLIEEYPDIADINLSLEKTKSIVSSIENCPHCGSNVLTVRRMGKPSCCPNCSRQIDGIGFDQSVDHADFSVDLFRTKDKIADRFHIRRKLGEGGYGVVYLAWDERLNREVAIKVPRIDRMRQDLLIREARAASQLKHPNIVRVYDAGFIGELTYVVCDYIEGVTLSRWEKRKKLHFVEAVGFALNIVRAIGYAHSQGIVHRDIKPGNIMVDAQSNPHVLDFGLSQSKVNTTDTIAFSGQMIGTPAFMAPEQALGQVREIGPWTDIYGLGVVLYQLLTGDMPFHGGSESLIDEIVHQPAPSMRTHHPSIPASLDAIVLKCLAKKPDDRYQTSADLAKDLERFLAGETVSVYQRFDSRVFKRRLKRIALPATILGLLTALTMLSLGWYFNTSLAKTPFLIEADTSTLTWLPLDVATGHWDHDKRVELRSGRVQRLPPGLYKVTAQTEKNYHEVYRTIPSQPLEGKKEEGVVRGIDGIDFLPHLNWTWNKGVAKLDPLRFVGDPSSGQGMVYVAGGNMSFPADFSVSIELKGKSREIAPFLIDQYPVSVQEFKQAFPSFNRLDDDPLDSTAHSINWHIAAAFAEKMGKQLPDVWELYFVATNGGATRFPWGHEIGPEPDLEKDKTMGRPAIYGLVFGPAVWSGSWISREVLSFDNNLKQEMVIPADINKRLVFGASMQQREQMGMVGILSTFGLPQFRAGVWDSSPMIGLRLVRRLPR